MTTIEPALRDQIRTVLAEHAHLSVAIEEVGDDDDLYEAGMSSHASVGVMLALEDSFDLEFPDELLTRRVFASVSSIADAVASLQAPA